MLVSALVCLLAACLLATLASAAAALPAYEILQLGFTDAEHTSSFDGYRNSGSSLPTASGYAIGQSMRFSGGGAQLGFSAWLFDLSASTTTRLGYFDAAHTRDDGFRDSGGGWLTEGYVLGASTRYLPGDGPETGVRPGRSVWLYDVHSGTTTRLGYFDAAHIRNDGFQLSSVIASNESGYVLGTSDRFGVSGVGLSAWLYDAGSGTTTRLGYYDAAHTRFDGTQTSTATMLTQSGYATGSSSRYGPYLGNAASSAWLYNAASGVTTRVGLLDAEHTRSDGYQYSVPTFVTESGDLVGDSLRYGGLFNGGQSAWYYDSAGGTTTRMGLVDTGHTRSDGYQFSSVRFATESGFAAGRSAQFGGPVEGVSAWLFDSSTGTTSRLGFFDAAHTRNDGYQISHPRFLTESGYAIGISLRYSGGTTGNQGSAQSAWIYDPRAAATTRLGYFDAAHTRSDGYQFSTSTFATDSGYVAGTSQRYNGATDSGRSAWLYDAAAGATTRLGFFDAPHTRSDGFQFTSTTSVTESGYAIGDSRRYNGASDSGRSAWIFDAGAATTSRLGYFDAVHTRSDGFQLSSALELTESGYVAGQSDRYKGGTAPLGHTSWIYRASDQSQHIIVLSERSDGYAESSVYFLGGDGLALGSYELYAEDDTWLGGRAFAWTPTDGAFDLGALVVGLTAAGWDHLASAIRANGLEQIVGSGRLQSGGDLAYLLIAIPEPGTALLVSVGLLGVGAWRKAQRDAA